MFGSYYLIYSQAKQLGYETSMLHSISDISNWQEQKINIIKFPIINSIIKIINGSPSKKEIKILLNRKFKNE